MLQRYLLHSLPRGWRSLTGVLLDNHWIFDIRQEHRQQWRLSNTCQPLTGELLRSRWMMAASVQFCADHKGLSQWQSVPKQAALADLRVTLQLSMCFAAGSCSTDKRYQHLPSFWMLLSWMLLSPWIWRCWNLSRRCLITMDVIIVFLALGIPRQNNVYLLVLSHFWNSAESRSH